MLVSVFTPSHNPTWLPDCLKSLKRQTYQNWEWVIVPNGPGLEAVRQWAEHAAETEPRIRIRLADEKSQNIGMLKRLACATCTGELFVEFDHDDVLTHDCLQLVVDAYKAADFGQPIFIYSHDVTLEEDGTSSTFSSKYGWTHENWVYRGKTYVYNKQFSIHPRSLCEILYAPDHVRVWNRKAYEMSGGHDVRLRYCDDHLLMIKTYLCGAEFIEIKQPTYFHRLRKNNTCIPNVEGIQQLSRNHRDEYLRDLVHEWARRNDYKMYDLGGAHNCPDRYIPIDPHLPEGKGISKNIFEVDIEPNSVGVFRAHDFLEHIPGPQIPQLLNKLYDALVPGGWLLTMTPAVEDNDGRVGRGAFQDPTHVSYWSTNNWWYYTDKDFAKYIPEIRCRFQAATMGTYYPSDWHAEHHIPYVRADLCALKKENTHWPGLVLI